MLFFSNAYIKTAKKGKNMISNSIAKRKKGAHVVSKRSTKVAPKPEERGHSAAGRMTVVLSGVFVLLLALLVGFNQLYPSIFPGVTAGSIPVGGKSAEEAAQAIAAQGDALYADTAVTLSIYDKTYDIPVESVLESVDAAQSAENAFAVGRTGNPFARVWHMLCAFVGKGEAELAATVNTQGLETALGDIAAEALTEPVEPAWEAGADSLIIHAGKPGVHFDAQAVREAIDRKIRLMDFTPYTVSTELTETPAIDIDKIAAEAIGEPVSATVDKADGTTILPEKAGVQFDVEQARAIIGDGSAEQYVIPATVVQPKVTAADLEQKLFQDTLARTSTDLNEGNVPRTNNVRLASNAINGLILNPGEEFSYNNVVGERTEARGYRPAGAYSGGKIVEEFGGGVCQPSSTLYMAVLRADLEVTERYNHSFTVGYTPLGEDATVSWGGPDFRFRNNTDYPVKILAEQTGGQMIMTLIGTKTSDKTVTTRTEVLSTYAPQTVEKKDASMKEGQSRVDQTGITGYATRTYKQITENGQTTEVLANSSNYSKRDKIVYVGTIKPEAPQESDPEQGAAQEGNEQAGADPAPAGDAGVDSSAPEEQAQ